MTVTYILKYLTRREKFILIAKYENATWDTSFLFMETIISLDEVRSYWSQKNGKLSWLYSPKSSVSKDKIKLKIILAGNIVSLYSLKSIRSFKIFFFF